MKLRAFAMALAITGLQAPPAPAKLPPLRDPVFLNIGFVCQWKDSCIRTQQAAMKRSLAYVKATNPPTWKIQTCNRNASRQRERVDWIGYEHCIRNPSIKKPKKQRR